MYRRVRGAQGSIVTLVHCEEEDDEDDEGDSGRLLRALTHQCTLSLRVEGLATGYCRDIHGQVRMFTAAELNAVKRFHRPHLHDAE